MKQDKVLQELENNMTAEAAKKAKVINAMMQFRQFIREPDDDKALTLAKNAFDDLLKAII